MEIKEDICIRCQQPKTKLRRVAKDETGKKYFTGVELYFCTNPKCLLSVEINKIKNWKI